MISDQLETRDLPSGGSAKHVITQRYAMSLSFGSPAVSGFWKPVRPVTLRHCVSTVLPFSHDRRRPCWVFVILECSKESARRKVIVDPGHPEQVRRLPPSGRSGLRRLPQSTGGTSGDARLQARPFLNLTRNPPAESAHARHRNVPFRAEARTDRHSLPPACPSHQPSRSRLARW